MLSAPFCFLPLFFMSGLLPGSAMVTLLLRRVSLPKSYEPENNISGRPFTAAVMKKRWGPAPWRLQLFSAPQRRKRAARLPPAAGLKPYSWPRTYKQGQSSAAAGADQRGDAADRRCRTQPGNAGRSLLAHCRKQAEQDQQTEQQRGRCKDPRGQGEKVGIPKRRQAEIRKCLDQLLARPRRKYQHGAIGKISRTRAAANKPAAPIAAGNGFLWTVSRVQPPRILVFEALVEIAMPPRPTAAKREPAALNLN